MYRKGGPLGVHEVQRGVGLQSASAAHYHIRKLVEARLVQEMDEGYVVDRLIFENMLRIGRSLIPVQATFAAFFAATLFFLLTTFRPAEFSSTYVFSLFINSASLAVFLYQTIIAFRRGNL
jgi:hypothetical protein